MRPGNYNYVIVPLALTHSFLIAFVSRISGLRDLTKRCGHFLRTSNHSSLSHALKRDSSPAFARELLRRLEATHAPRKGELVGVDSMALSLAKTRRHHCKKSNNNTVGLGVLWTFAIKTLKGASPVKILKIAQGAWHDTTLMDSVTLVPKGPIYLMDRGFYAFRHIERWLSEGVRFVLRARTRGLQYKVLKHLSRPRVIGANKLLLDARVRLGAPSAKRHPVVRMVEALLADGERLVLVTDRTEWSAEEILAAYAKRWHIERFHRFLKDTLGLSHLYSFHSNGLLFLLHTALLLALLLLLGTAKSGKETIAMLHHALGALRRTLGLGTAWRRNTYTRRRKKKKSAKKILKIH